jgi:YVTN family beta-propeller protein
MKILKYLFLFLAVLIFSSHIEAQDSIWIADSPCGDEYTHIDKNGITIIPDGRYIKPFGNQLVIAPHPFGLILSPNGNIAVTANSGVRPFSVSIIKDVFSSSPHVQQIPKGYQTDKGILASVYMGLAISPDNKILYVAGGQEGKIYLFDLETGDKSGEIDCNTDINSEDFEDSYIGDMTISKDGNYIFAVDQTNFRMITVDTKSQKIISSVKTGRYPFGIALSPDEKKVYVANVGMYEYKKIGGIDPKDIEHTGLKYPPFGYLSKESEEGIENDSMKVPGLGKPNVPESFSVWTIKLDNIEKPEVTAKIKTGILVGEPVDGIPAVGGASPNSIAATDKYVFVSNGNNDCISIINAETNTVEKNLFLRIDKRLGNLRGIIPYGVALSPDMKRLYVAEAGINAVGIIDIPTLTVIGEIPVGWFPSKLKVSLDGKKIIVANAKGFGSGPNGGMNFTPGPEGTYIGDLMNGTVSILDIPSDNEIKKLTAQVVKNNFDFAESNSEKFNWRKNNPVPLYPGEKESPIKYVVFIAKENRTFDEIFGQVKKADGDSSLARYGAHQTFSNHSGSYVEDVTVMVNHLELAERFGIGDNFYCNSDHSADGHRWLAGTYPNEWVETDVPSAYGGGRDMKFDSKAPGELAMTGSAASIVPEDYNESGSLWDQLERGKINFYNFGLGLEMAPGIEEMAYKYTGIRYVINYPVPAPMMNHTSKIYATFNTSIPDQFRVDMFEKEFKEKWIDSAKDMPAFMTVYLPNDHGSGPRPKDGYPYIQSYMMDNDLGLGRVVDFLSHTKYWKNMAIFVTEDDPQGGVDHVDAHRSVLMAISPYAKKNYVSHVHYSFGSIMKTFWHILGLPYLNQYDFAATDLADLFTDKPDYSPYNVKPVDPDVFNPQKALTPFDANFDWNAFRESPEIDNPELMEKWNKSDLESRMHLADPPFPPEITPNGDLFTDSVVVTLENVFQKAKIHYTLDGSEPTPESPEYKGKITITSSTELKTKAFWETNLGSKTKSAEFKKAVLLNPAGNENTAVGILFKYYYGDWEKLPDFEKLQEVRASTISELNIDSLKPRDANWGAVFTGFINVPVDGLYTFYLGSDDGSRMFIQDQMVIDNDGLHGSSEVPGKIALKKGKHPFRIEFFQGSGGQELTLQYECMGIKKQPVPGSAFSH